MTGDPDGPPTLPGYSSADNSTGLAAALGLLAQIVSGRGGQVDVSLRDVMLSQLNYRASAYLNDGAEPRRVTVRCALVLRSRAALSDGRRISGAVHHPRRVLEILRRRSRDRRFPDDGRARGPARGGARRRHGGAGHRHRRRVGRPGCVRSAFRRPRCGRCPRRWRPHPRSSSPPETSAWSAARSAIAGYEPDYRPPPGLDERADITAHSS